MLSDEQIENLNYISMNRLDYEIFEIDQSSVKDFARAIEAEAHKQDTELIQQMLDALNTCTYETSGAHEQIFDDALVDLAITAARARLENT